MIYWMDGQELTPPSVAAAVRNVRKPAAAGVLLLSCAGELLGERRTFAQDGAFPVDDVDGDDEDETDASEDRAGVLEVVAGFAADVGEEGGGGDCEDTGQEVASPAVAAGCGGGVGSVSADHVVYRCHVNRVVRDSNNCGEDHATHPVDWGTLDRPGEAEEADWQAGGGVEEEPEAGLVLGAFVLGFVAAFLFVAPDGWDEEGPGDAVAYTDGQEGETDFEGLEVPLAVDKHEGLDEHEDQGVGETGEERQDQHDWLGKEHLERTDPGDDDFFGGEAVFEGDEFIRSPNIGFSATVLDGLLTTLLSDAVQHDRCASFGDGEEVNGLDEAAKDELDPDAPSGGDVSRLTRTIDGFVLTSKRDIAHRIHQR